jgi:uncharacterized membrane protein YuzA (DUF378 family)
MMKVMDLINVTAMVLLFVGGINWGLVGFFNVDLVAKLFGDATLATHIVYDLVGLCALYEAIKWTRGTKTA